MRLRWTVVDPRGGSPGTTDVVVRCPRGTPLAEVLIRLARVHPTRPSPSGRRQTVAVGGRLQGDDAVVGRPPLLDGAVLTWTDGHGRASRDEPPARVLEVVVTAGPDAGTVVPVSRRDLLVGRAADCDVRLSDPRLSRTHFRLTVSSDGVRVSDAGSTNGTQHGAPGVAGSSRLQLDEGWRAGAGRLRLRATTGGRTPPVPALDTGEGTREVRRPPRARSPEHAPELVLPPPGRPGRTSGFPVLAVVLPALAAGGLAWWTGSAVYLALAALGPLLVAGSWWTARRDARREGVLGRRAYVRACAEVRAAAEVAGTALAAARANAMPDASTLLEDCAAVAGCLWERHHSDADAVRLRLGHPVPEVPRGSSRGTVHRSPLTARVRVVDHEGHAQEVVTEDDLLSVDLRDGALGVVEVGDPSGARFLVGQLVALLPPSSLTVVPLVGRRAEQRWAWLRLLPHVAPRGPGGDLRSAVTTLARLASTRSAAPGGGSSTGSSTGPPLVLAVVDDPDGELDAADLDRLADGHRVGVHVLVVAADPRLLPRLCTTVLTAGSPDGVETRLVRVADGAESRAVLDRVAPWWSTRLARALAPLRVPAADEADALPPRVALTDLLDLSPTSIARRWSTARGGLEVPLGVGAAGPVAVDLTTAGPHALVAGTTGSGKSELLRSWVLAMAATHPPEHLAVLLVDYKGGATFDDLAVLPHCVGLLTDLDGPATARVLHSLRAEVRRREHLLAAAGARDLASYRRAAPPGADLPRLLVVVDEFRVLAEDAPEVLGQFVRLAATGRSLGIHLVLATQRPAGVVSTEIRANAALRIALRVQDAAESRDVVERPDAAWLPPDAPGRAVVVGAGLDAVVQTAWTGGADDGPAVDVTLADACEGTAPPPRPPPGGGTADDGAGDAVAHDAARQVVADVRQAVTMSGREPSRPPWLPPLPDLVRAADAARLLDAPAPDALLLGVADLPWAQARRALLWRPTADGPLLVLGAGRSGRSTTLDVVAEAAGAAGAVVVRLSAAPGAEDHVVDVLTALTAPPPPTEEDGAPPRPEGLARRPCRVLLVVDDVDEALDPGADPTVADLLLRLLRSAHRDGVGVALAGGRALASSRLAGTARARLVHRTLDRGDALVAGVPPGAGPLPAVPGRCHALGLGPGPTPDGGAGGAAAVEVQVLRPDDRGDGHGRAGREGAAAGRTRGPRWVPRPLPARLTVESLPPPSAAALPLGLTGPAGQAWLLDLAPGGLLAVAGPAGSGRTTTLRLLDHQATSVGLAVRWCRSAVTGPGGDRGPGDGGDLADLLLLDDVDRADEATSTRLEAWLTTRSGPLAGVLRPGATVVVAGAASWFADGFRGVPALARQSGRGLVLSAGRTDVRDVLGVRGAPAQNERHPGRGLVVAQGQVRRVQVALPPPETGPPASVRGSPTVLLPSGVTTTGGPPP